MREAVIVSAARTPIGKAYRGREDWHDIEKEAQEWIETGSTYVFLFEREKRQTE